MIQSIYPENLAEIKKPMVGDKYRPGNGTEGEVFINAWCCHCQRDKAMSEGEDFNECDDDERCDIIADTFAYAIDDEKYPKEWQIGKDGQPCCTAFVPLGDPIPPPRDDLTVDMFGVKP